MYDYVLKEKKTLLCKRKSEQNMTLFWKMFCGVGLNNNGLSLSYSTLFPVNAMFIS